MKKMQVVSYGLICFVGVAAGIVIGDYWRPTGNKAHFALMERNSIVVDAVFGDGIKDEETLGRVVLKPIQRVIDDYTSRGYVVIDVTSDTSCDRTKANDQAARCGYTLLGVPAPMVDITNDLREVVATAKKAEQIGAKQP